MNPGFYFKIALDGIRKNKRMYFPYILTGCVMVMMYYILNFLTESPALEKMPGGTILMTFLLLGITVMGVFSLLFLFYTNWFLIKQRYTELGLYNILGMDKRNISCIMICETLLTALASIVVGLGMGIAFSKAAELILLNILHMKIDFELTIGRLAIRNTFIHFAGIYMILLFNAIIRVYLSKPLELLQSKNVGEKKLKCNWLFALIGTGMLGVAYYLAVSIEEPTTAFFVFFIAVLLVILGTYLLFISGSVAICKLLQKNKKYYYRPNHFVSVSSMAYRMKRNGAGLATICILLTMVLVMISSTTTLYIGEENALKNRYPNCINIKIFFNQMEGISDENLNVMREDIETYSGKDKELDGTRTCAVAGMFTEEGILIDASTADPLINYDKMGYLYVMSLEDYNNTMNENKTLADDECFIYSNRLTTQWSTFTMEYGHTYKVKEQLTSFKEDNDALAMTMPSVYMIVNDLYAFAEPVFNLANFAGNSMMEYIWQVGFDTVSAEEEIYIRNKIDEIIQSYKDNGNLIQSFYVQSRETERNAFYEMYGSLFFLGIMLSSVFLIATVLIIYYKQISEGYEDQNRFEIMEKVGMTKKEIRKNINSQMLTVFFLPLVTAGIHLAFAFSVISKILVIFAFNDTRLNMKVTFFCFAIAGLIYAVVYKITSGFYYAIVIRKTENLTSFYNNK